MKRHKEKIIELHLKGNSYKQIQDALGCSKGTISYHLGNQVKEKNYERSTKNKRKNLKEIQDYKEYIGCMDCKNKYPHYMLDFDHRSGEIKRGTVYKILSSGGKILAWEEIKKCDIVCPNCHRKRTYERNPW